MFKVVLSLALLSLPVIAQTKSSKSTLRPAKVSGRVFGISQSGDLKPARMASVYMFSGPVYLEWTTLSLGAEEAAHAYQKEQFAKDTSSSDAAFEELRQLICHHGLALQLNAILKTVEWADANNKKGQVLHAQTDEEGKFEFVVRPGTWQLVAYGHAGANTALWDDSSYELIIESGGSYTAKLSSPSTVCLNTE